MEGLAFGLGMILSSLIIVAYFRTIGAPLPPRPSPQVVFRFVHREDRAAYVRIMRRSLAVQMRDLNRALMQLNRTIGKALLPTLERMTLALSRIFDR